MKAYISYSVGEEEMPVITRLSWGLRDEGYIPVSGTLSSPEIEMRNASLFIGVVTAIGSRQERVLGEWELARQKQIPYLMLIEQDCWHISQLKLEDNVIIFDRNDPDKATKIITKRITASKKENAVVSFLKKNWVWFTAGTVLLGVVILLSKIFSKNEEVAA